MAAICGRRDRISKNLQIITIGMKYRSVIIVLILMLSTIEGYSQKANCTTVIIEAEDMYRAGKYDEAIQLLKTALDECKFSKREKEDAYIILAKSYLEKDNYSEADRLLVRILNNDPNFKLKENLYQEDFYSYYNRIKIRPMISGGLKLGMNIPRYSIKHLNTVYNSADYSLAYKPVVGYMYGMFAEYQFYDNISVLTEGCFSKMAYKRTIEGSGNLGLLIHYSEALKCYEQTLNVKKYFLHKQFRPFVYLGGYLSYLHTATADIELTYKLKDNITPDVDDYYLSKNNIDVLAMRNTKRGGLVVGSGISYKTKNILISADAAYRMDIGKHLTNSANKNKNEELLYKYYYIDNDVTLSRLDVSITVAYIFKYSVKSK